MSDYRPNLGVGDEPIQSSVVRDMRDYGHLTAISFELGIVLSVYPSDSVNNRTAKASSIRRGWRHECTVQVVGNGHGGDYLLSHVVIPPKSPSGVDSYEEQLPRPCSKTFKEGGEFDPTMRQSTPSDLDGDWCVVGFLKRDYDQPFIVAWWPNPNNTYDPQTEGMGNPDSSGRGKALNQTGRYFKRTNGVEHIITAEGDVYFDTTLAGEEILVTEPIKNGRIAREPSESGGNIRTVLKPTASVEVDFNTPSNGIGILDQKDISLPQSNPAVPSSSSSQRENTYLKLDKDVLHLKCPSTVTFEGSSVELNAAEIASLIAPSVSIGNSDTASFIAGNSLEVETNSVSIVSPSITIGNGGELPLITSAAAEAVSTAHSILTAALATPVTTTAHAAAAITAIGAFCTALNAALSAGQTVATKAG